MFNAFNPCRILQKLEFSRQIFLNPSNTKYHENRSSGNLSVLYGWKDERPDRLI
jgi:hypothetical protein